MTDTTTSELQLNGLRAALGATAFAFLQQRSGALTALATLRERHQALWALEDRARSKLATDHEITTVKRGIDAENGARHKTIDLVDQALAAAAVPASPIAGARRSSETIGELCDRLIILGLKLANMEKLASDAGLPAAERDRCAQNLQRQTVWRGHLHACLEQLLEDAAKGAVVLPPRSEFKLYNEKMLNPVTRGES
jgi:hypothetical protein